MTQKTPFDIPDSVRDVAGKSVDQAREAYRNFAEASRKAQDFIERATGSAQAQAKTIQEKSLQYADENMKSGFALAEKLLKAKDFQETLEIQATFARQQVEAYTRQAEELSRLISEAAKKARG
ncbi:MAG: phasin family protein [Hyphomicrobiales bacterium]